MKTYVTSQLAAHLAGPVLTIAWCWIIRRRDGVVFGFTTHVEDLKITSRIDGLLGLVTCKASSGFLATDIAMSDTLAQNNLDVTGVLDDDAVTEEDLRAGLYRAAEYEVCIVNYRDLTMGTNTVNMGTLGGVTAGSQQWKVEARGLTQPLEANMDGVTSDHCDARLGDARCGVDLVPFTRTGTIDSKTDDRVFVDTARTEADGWWTKGEITMTSGPSAGQSKEVKRSLANGTIELVEEFFFGVEVGDAYSMTPGCNKLLWMPDGTVTGDCKNKYGNVIRFRGFKVPGQDKINQYGGQGA